MDNTTTNDTLAGRCAQYLLENSVTCFTDEGVHVVMMVTSATLYELVDLVNNEKKRDG